MLRRSDIFVRLAAGLALLVIWECVAGVVRDPRLAPHLWELFTLSFPSFALFNGGQDDYREAARMLAGCAKSTVWRALAGLALGGISGILAGLAAHFFRDQRGAHKLLLGLVRSAPLFSLLPLWLYWFSGSQLGIVSYVSFAVFVFVATGCYEAILDVPQSLLWQARLLGATRLTLFRTVVLPAISPRLARTFRWVTGLLLAFSLGAEYLSSDSSGLGWLVYRSYLYANVGQLLVLAGVYAMLGGLFIQVFDWALTRITILNHSA